METRAKKVVEKEREKRINLFVSGGCGGFD
jgi:hypothetical protein